MINQFVKPQMGPLHKRRVSATGLYSGSDLATVGIMYGAANSSSSLSSRTISSRASGGREERRSGKRVWIVLTE